MQNVFEENINIIKIVCSAALVYLAYKLLGSLYEIKSLIDFCRIFRFLKNEKSDLLNQEKTKEQIPIEIKNSKNILFKMPKEKNNTLQEISINSYNFTPIVNKFSIFTYNILCQKFMMRRDRKDLSLENRMVRIKEQISSLDPDIICLQECVFHSIKLHLESFLSVNYEIYYIENYGSNFYNLTAFKKEKFELKENKKINLDDIKVEGNRGISCLELKIKNKLNDIISNQMANNSLKKSNLSDYKNNENNKEEPKNTSNLEEKYQANKKEKLEESNTDEKIINQINSNNNLKSSKSYKNKERTHNFFYNYRNFIEYNKAENKNKLVIYNVHFPWKPIFDFEKCLILNKIADDVMSKNQRNYIIIGDFNSKPNSLLMRMIYLENFINEIKYFKNIVNFKSDYFKKRNSEEISKKEKNTGFYDYDTSPTNKKKTKYNFITTEKVESLLEKNDKSNKKPIDQDKVNDLISNFDILKELKDLKNNSTHEKLNDPKNYNDQKKINEDTNIPSIKASNTVENNVNFWTKLSEQKHQENICNKKIKEYDILKELFYLNVKLEKDRHNFSFDSKDKIILKEILKLLTLSDNKKIFNDVFSNPNLNDFNNNYFNNQYFQINEMQAFNNRNLNPKYLNDHQIMNNMNDYNLINNNYMISNQLNKEIKNNQNKFNLSMNQNIIYNHFNKESNYNQNIVEITQNNLNVGISISNDNYIKIRNMIDNFKNLYIKYKFRSAYDSYQIEENRSKEILNFIENQKLDIISDKIILEFYKTFKKNDLKIEKSNLIKNENNLNESVLKANFFDENKSTSHISDYFKNHPLYTNFTDNFKDTIDYIFYSKYLVIEKILKLPDYNELVSEGFLPSSKYPSDHLPLYAEFYTN